MKKIIVSSFVIATIFALTLMAQSYNVDVSKVPNGTYLGVFRHGKGMYDFTYQAAVTVQSGKITKIMPVKMPSRAANRIAETAFAKMIQANKVDADATTKASYQGVVYNALTDQTPYKE